MEAYPAASEEGKLTRSKNEIKNENEKVAKSLRREYKSKNHQGYVLLFAVIWPVGRVSGHAYSANNDNVYASWS